MIARCILPVVFLLFACTSMKESDANNKKTSLYSILRSAEYGGRETASSLIIENQSDLNTLFDSVNSEERPTVDFSKSQVVVLFMGTKKSGGYSISIENVVEVDDKIFVYQKVSTPKPGDMVTMALTNPYVIAEIRSKKEIVFK